MSTSIILLILFSAHATPPDGRSSEPKVSVREYKLPADLRILDWSWSRDVVYASIGTVGNQPISNAYVWEFGGDRLGTLTKTKEGKSMLTIVDFDDD